MAKIIPTLRKQNHPLSQTEQQRQILEALPLRSFAEASASAGHRPLRANGIEVLRNGGWVDVPYYPVGQLGWSPL